MEAGEQGSSRKLPGHLPQGSQKRRALERSTQPEDPDFKRRLEEAQRVYGRGNTVATRQVKDKKLRSNLKALESKYRDATLKAKDAEILLENTSGFLEPEGELERTYKVRQDELKANVAVETAKKGFELKLEGLGPYAAEYTRNGRDLLLWGRKGHVATMNWTEGKLMSELQLGETVRDARWLHNNQYFAVAQKKSVYIYDYAGVELHCLERLSEVSHMEFLPYHFLLATIVSSLELLNFGFHINVTDSGHRRSLEIHRHLDRAAGGRISHWAWLAHVIRAEPVQRDSARWPPERKRKSLVAKLVDASSQVVAAPRPGTLHGDRS